MATCWPSVSIEWPAPRGMSARTRRSRARRADTSRRTNACTVPRVIAGPAHARCVSGSLSSVTRASISSTSSPKVRTVVPSSCQAPSSPTAMPCFSRRVTLWMTIVYWLRSSSASANTNGSSSSRQKSSSVHQKLRTPLVRADTSGAPLMSPATRRREHTHRLERRGLQTDLVVLGAPLGCSAVRPVEEQEVFTFDVEDERLAVLACRAEHVGVEHRVQQEGGVARLGGDARDAGDVDVRAARAVDEIDVQIERTAVAAQADRQPALHRVEVEGDVALLARGPAHLGAGRGRHVHLGLEPGGEHVRRLTDLGGSNPSAMRNTSESKLAPSWRARTSDTMPAIRDTTGAPGTSRSHTTTSSSCRYWPSATATQKSSGVASSVPSTRPTAGTPTAGRVGLSTSATVTAGCDGAGEPA